uniref:Hexosyltransferase n=1 Tax=Angiostrongylus cantonensis TaxID=6313 RepID=A0A0K0D2F7_ANGCA
MGDRHELHSYSVLLQSYSYANYVRKNCTNVKAILKVDDDIAWNVEKVFNFLGEIDPGEDVLYCQTVLKPWVERRKQERWLVSLISTPLS